MTAKKRSGSDAAPPGYPAGILGDEGGFILAFVMFLLAICTLLGVGAMHTSMDETDITSNEVIVRKVFSMAESGMPLGSIPLNLTPLGEKRWDADCANPVYLNDYDPEQEADEGVIQILDGDFLIEGRDYDMEYDTRWNNWNKYVNAPADAGHQNAFKPIDDPFAGTTAEKKAVGVDDCPDIRIRAATQLTIDVDVDKVAVKYAAGGVAEFGSGADGAAGMAVKVSYIFNCLATVPGKDIESIEAPKSEQSIGYGLLPTGI